jgi:putative ABC transport system permease protein
MLHEVRAAVRSVARRRGLALAIVFTLALGIGANSAIFSVIDAVLLKPLPYPDSERLTAVYEVNAGRHDRTSLVAPVRLEEWNRMNRSFDGLAGTYFENMTDTTGPLPERVEAMRVSPRFFVVLGTPAALGRTTTPAEETFGGPAVVVVSDAFWRSRLQSDPAAIGRTLILNGARRTIVGVMPPSFRYPSAETEAWIPAQHRAELLADRQARFYRTVGRLKRGVTPEQAAKDLAAVQRRLGEQFPQTDRGWSASVTPLKEEHVGGMRRSLWLLFGAVSLLLLASCGNVACLLLADATRRQHDVTVRFALGAERGMVVRQLLLEGLVLAVAGSVLGLLLARWGVDALRTAATDLPRAAELRVDARLVVFTLTLGVVTTVLFALAPALQATRYDIARRLVRGARGHVGGRQLLQRLLVAAQVSLAIVLLVGAGLLIRSFARLQQTSPGLDPRHVLTFRMSAAWSERPDAVARRQQRTLQRLLEIPGVTAATVSSMVPAGADVPPAEIRVAGRDTGEPLLAVARMVSADYFKTLRIPMLQGETCRDDPRPDTPIKVVVTRAFAERFFPGESPIGHHVVSRSPREIIGVVGDVRERGVARDPGPTMYMCGLIRFWPDPYFIVRTDPSRGVAMGTIRQALREIEPQRAVYAATPLVDALGETLSQPRLNTWLLALFAATALTLAAVGLYGMLAQFVSQRRREIGLRMALGARPAQVIARVLKHGASVTAVGIGLGLIGAYAGARVMDAMVFGVSTHDPTTFIAVPLVLAAIAAGAMIVPARRAVRIEPVQALRED